MVVVRPSELLLAVSVSCCVPEGGLTRYQICEVVPAGLEVFTSWVKDWPVEVSARLLILKFRFAAWLVSNSVKTTRTRLVQFAFAAGTVKFQVLPLVQVPVMLVPTAVPETLMGPRENPASQAPTGVLVAVGECVVVPVDVPVGVAVGEAVAVGDQVGVRLGVPLGLAVAVMVGVQVGVPEGVYVGVAVGVTVGVALGLALGLAVGVSEGLAVGDAVGVAVGVSCGVSVAVAVGLAVGVTVGVTV